MRKTITKQMKREEQVAKAGERKAGITTTRKLTKEEAKASLAFIFGGTAAGTGVTTVASRGLITSGVNGKVSANHTFHVGNKNLSDEERVKRGLVVRLRGADYSTRLVNGNKVKACACCNKTYNVSNFSKSKNSFEGLMATCKDCDANRKASDTVFNKILRAEDVAQKVDRVCTTCKVEKSITLFSYAGTSFRGSKRICKCCESDKLASTKKTSKVYIPSSQKVVA